MRAKAFFTAGLLAAIGVAACAILDDPHQCATDEDCAGFGAVCDMAQAICVPSGSTGDDAASTEDAPTNNPSDGSTTDAPLPPQCTVSPKPVGNPATGLAAGVDGGAAVAGNLTLGCDKDWLLEGPLFVPNGATLTIQAGTTIKAKKGVGAQIFVQAGGKIIAEGQRDNPIVMTVDDPAPAAGNWLGLLITGDAAAPDSGSLAFVRVEYAQSGILFNQVGNTTKVDHVQVRYSNDNCFTFNGGNVDAKHLVCQTAVDEQFDIAAGYKGRLQFLYSQRYSGAGGNHNGILIDGNGTSPIIYNATICGLGTPPTAANYGVVFRNNAGFDLNNIVINGWYAAIEATGNLGNPRLFRSSRANNNGTNPAFAEDPAVDAGPLVNDDNGFDEIDFFLDGSSGFNNGLGNANLLGPHDQLAPKPWPNAMIAGRKPPADGFFDVNAEYIGAFKDANDTWMSGAWVRFDNK